MLWGEKLKFLNFSDYLLIFDISFLGYKVCFKVLFTMNKQFCCIVFVIFDWNLKKNICWGNFYYKSSITSSSLFSDRDSEDESSPFSTLHRHGSIGRDSDTEDSKSAFHMHRLRYIRRRCNNKIKKMINIYSIGVRVPRGVPWNTMILSVPVKKMMMKVLRYWRQRIYSLLFYRGWVSTYIKNRTAHIGVVLGARFNTKAECWWWCKAWIS